METRQQVMIICHFNTQSPLLGKINSVYECVNTATTQILFTRKGLQPRTFLATKKRQSRTGSTILKKDIDHIFQILFISITCSA